MRQRADRTVTIERDDGVHDRRRRQSKLRLRRPRTWSLKWQLLTTLLGLLTLVCCVVAAGTFVALRRYLIRQLDAQVVDAGWRSVMLYALGPPPLPDGSRPVTAGPGPDFLDAPGQASGTIGAVLSPSGSVQDAAVVTESGARQSVSSGAWNQLSGIGNSVPLSMDIDGLGGYRVIKVALPDGQSVVTGLPTGALDTVIASTLTMMALIVAAAFVVVSVAGTLLIRRQLTPLTAMAVSARGIAETETTDDNFCVPTHVVQIPKESQFTEVGQVGSALNLMMDRIAEAMQARRDSELRVRQFVADASHELRTPLTAICGYAELALRENRGVSSPVGHAMDRIYSEGRRMSLLVEDMLLLAHLDAGRPLDNDVVDLAQLAIDAARDAHVSGPQHTWELELPDRAVIVNGDKARLHQVLTNLLSNARVHTPPGTTVVTSVVSADSGGASLMVRDNGPGIPPRSSEGNL